MQCGYKSIQCRAQGRFPIDYRRQKRLGNLNKSPSTSANVGTAVRDLINQALTHMRGIELFFSTEKGEKMFIVLQNGKPADYFHFKVDSSWKNCLFKTKREAEEYVFSWAYCTSIQKDIAEVPKLEIGVDHDFSIRNENGLLMRIEEIETNCDNNIQICYMCGAIICIYENCDIHSEGSQQDENTWVCSQICYDEYYSKTK
jgi:hypothetical protein